jgi:hypothetical protein
MTRNPGSHGAVCERALSSGRLDRRGKRSGPWFDLRFLSDWAQSAANSTTRPCKFHDPSLIDRATARMPRQKPLDFCSPRHAPALERGCTPPCRCPRILASRGRRPEPRTSRGWCGGKVVFRRTRRRSRGVLSRLRDNGASAGMPSTSRGRGEELRQRDRALAIQSMNPSWNCSKRWAASPLVAGAYVNRPTLRRTLHRRRLLAVP